MNKFFIPFLLCFFTLSVKAQTQPASTSVNLQSAPGSFHETQPYGKVDQADLEMTSCDFEKDANAEVLFDKGSLTDNGFYRHIRIKIFNEFGQKEASIRLEDTRSIKDIEGETINLNNGKIEITPLDKKLIYIEDIDRIHSATVFALPNARPGSIIEFKYRADFNGLWFFQSNLPTRYSEIHTDFPGGRTFKFIPHVKQPYVKDIGKADDFDQIKALANIKSLQDEPYMSSRFYNLQRIEYIGIIGGFNTWPKIGDLILKYFDRDQQVDGNIKGEKEIIAKAKSLKTDDEKIAFIFDQVKNSMKWNNIVSFFVKDGSERVWENKIGNSAEINWMVYHLLKKAGIKSYPMIVSNKIYGKLNPAIPNLFILANLIVYVPIDSTKNYVLDATNKYNLFNEVPADELNTFGLNLDEDNQFYQTIFLENVEPAMQSVFLNVEIKPEGKMTGTAEINSYSYNKTNALKKYKTDGEEKYAKYLCNNDNSIKISSLKLEGMDVDTLPLTQKIDFNADLTGSDQNYLYFNTDLFNLMGDNPFKNEERISDIDFGYRDNYAITGVYKLPAGYKTDALPKSVTIVMPDGSIVFKRTVAEQDGSVLVKYTLNHKKTLYFNEDYQDIRGFYKKMYELLNEQIVLKKS
jgi:hypothetical protein